MKNEVTVHLGRLSGWACSVYKENKLHYTKEDLTKTEAKGLSDLVKDYSKEKLIKEGFTKVDNNFINFVKETYKKALGI